MTFTERRRPEELATLYELEPSIREVVVEGVDDAALLRWYLDRRCASAVGILVIDAVDVPAKMVEDYGLAGGNRERVLALAWFLEGALEGEARNCVTLVVDADWSRFFGEGRTTDLLLSTDFTCLEMYLFQESVMGKMITVVLGGGSMSARDVLTALGSILKRLWLMKITNHSLGFGMTWRPFLRECSNNGKVIDFKEERYVGKYLASNGRTKSRRCFQERIAEFSERLDGDPRHAIDGHHFIELARWYLRFHVRDRGPLKDRRSFERAFFGCIELADLDDHSMFQALLGRVKA